MPRLFKYKKFPFKFKFNIREIIKGCLKTIKNTILLLVKAYTGSIEFKSNN